jgi:hypothetical protein
VLSPEGLMTRTEVSGSKVAPVIEEIISYFPDIVQTGAVPKRVVEANIEEQLPPVIVVSNNKC